MEVKRTWRLVLVGPAFADPLSIANAAADALRAKRIRRPLNETDIAQEFECSLDGDHITVVCVVPPVYYVESAIRDISTTADAVILVVNIADGQRALAAPYVAALNEMIALHPTMPIATVINSWPLAASERPAADVDLVKFDKCTAAVFRVSVGRSSKEQDQRDSVRVLHGIVALLRQGPPSMHARISRE